MEILKAIESSWLYLFGPLMAICAVLGLVAPLVSTKYERIQTRAQVRRQLDSLRGRSASGWWKGLLLTSRSFVILTGKIGTIVGVFLVLRAVFPELNYYFYVAAVLIVSAYCLHHFWPHKRRLSAKENRKNNLKRKKKNK